MSLISEFVAASTVPYFCNVKPVIQCSAAAFLYFYHTQQKIMCLVHHTIPVVGNWFVLYSSQIRSACW